VTVWTTPERLALRETVRGFVNQEILPHLTQWERDGEIPRELHRKAGALGLLGASAPESAGGEGGDAVDSIVICEEMHQAGASGRAVRIALHLRHRGAAPDCSGRRGADREVGQADPARRQDRLARHHRAWRRQRRRASDNHSQARRRSLRRERRQDVHHLRRSSRLRRYPQCAPVAPARVVSHCS